MSSHISVDDLAREKISEIESKFKLSENPRPELISSWFTILKQIITAADLHRSNDNKVGQDSESKRKEETGDVIYADYADDSERINTSNLTEQFATNPVKWTIRVEAFKLILRLLPLLKTRHLPELIRLSFVAATSPYDDLKLQGFETFRVLINRFANVEEKEYPGHSILEQYRTQVISAIKPAFNYDAPPYITAIASQVCCLWICRGLEIDPVGLKKTYQLMMATIEKLENQSMNPNSKLYTESELEQERLDILGSWAQLYIKVGELDDGKVNKSINVLRQLVKPQVEELVDKWWEALREYALLIIPKSKDNSLPSMNSFTNGQVYTGGTALKLFEPVWPKLVLATSLWLCNDYHSSDSGWTREGSDTDSPTRDSSDKINYSKFICGIVMKELSDSANSSKDLNSQKDSLTTTTLIVVKSLTILFKDEDFKSVFEKDLTMASEFCRVLNYIIMYRTKSKSPHRNLIKKLLDMILLQITNKYKDDQSDVTIK